MSNPRMKKPTGTLLFSLRAVGGPSTLSHIVQSYQSCTVHKKIRIGSQPGAPQRGGFGRQVAFRDGTCRCSGNAPLQRFFFGVPGIGLVQLVGSIKENDFLLTCLVGVDKMNTSLLDCYSIHNYQKITSSQSLRRQIIMN